MLIQMNCVGFGLKNWPKSLGHMKIEEIYYLIPDKSLDEVLRRVFTNLCSFGTPVGVTELIFI